MPARSGRINLNRMLMMALLAIALSLPLAGCQRESEAAAPVPRPVRTISVEKREAGEPLTFTGRIEAEDEVSLAFRISGRILEHKGSVGDRVQAGQLIARLESQNELNTLRQAQAGLAAAQGQLTQARNHFERLVFAHRRKPSVAGSTARERNGKAHIGIVAQSAFRALRLRD